MLRVAMVSAVVVVQVACLLVWPAEVTSAQSLTGARVDLRVLVLASGSRSTDLERDVIETALENIGVAYEVIDVTSAALGVATLRTGTVGRFNGIVLTSNQLGGGLDAGEWAVLHDYQRDFDVRQAVLSGPPTTQGGVTLGLSLGSSASPGATGTWSTEAAASFPYYDTSTGLPVGISSPTVVATAVADPAVTPLVRLGPSSLLLAQLTYADGREILYAPMPQRPWLRSSQILAYAFVDFATRGLHLGAPRMYLAAHVDDLFLSTAMWGIGSGGTGPEQFRLSAADWHAAVARQEALSSAHPTAAGFALEHAFNGVGASTTPGMDALTDAVVSTRDHFTFLNHTFTHRILDASRGWGQGVIEGEVAANNQVWAALGLPGSGTDATRAIVTGGHSGLSDGATPYPAGVNPVMVAAFANTGVRYVGGDTSQPNQRRPSFVPGSGTELTLVPRWPTSLFYNVDTPARLVDEFRFLYGGSASYGDIRSLEASATFAHISSFANYPHFFHAANLRDYAGAGNSLLFDWIDDAVGLYESHFTLPLVTLPFHRIGEATEARLRLAGAGLRATLDLASGQVMVDAANYPASFSLTGVQGPFYGPVRVRDVVLSGPVTFAAAGYQPPPTCAGLIVTVDIGLGQAPTAGADVILGTAGPDVIAGSGGADTICGAGGDDTINAGPGADTVSGGDGADTIFGSSGDDMILGDAGADVIQGNGGLDTIDGGAGADTLSGNEDADTLTGGADGDTIFGAAGDDVIQGDGGPDVVQGGPGVDTIGGGDGDDLVSGNDGNDVLHGNSGVDTLYGVGGNDTVTGGIGADTVLGGIGNDVIDGGDGDDAISGNDDDDTIDGGAGADTIYGVAGADVLDGGAGTDTVLGGDGADVIGGGDDGDLLSGNAGVDQVAGGGGADEIYGADGADSLVGGAGQDVMLGGNDDDAIDSVDGEIDQVSGNAGSDTCTRDIAPVDVVFACEIIG